MIFNAMWNVSAFCKKNWKNASRSRNGNKKISFANFLIFMNSFVISSASCAQNGLHKVS